MILTIMAITHFLFIYKSASFLFLFFGNKYEMLTNGKVKNKCKFRILGAKFGNHACWKWGGQSFVFKGADSLKKLSGFYF